MLAAWEQLAGQLALWETVAIFIGIPALLFLLIVVAVLLSSRSHTIDPDEPVLGTPPSDRPAKPVAETPDCPLAGGEDTDEGTGSA